MSLGDVLKGYEPGQDENIDMMIKRYDEIIKEEEIVKKRGYQIHGYCWKCKKYKHKLQYKICSNGHLTYWCFVCSRIDAFMNGDINA